VGRPPVTARSPLDIYNPLRFLATGMKWCRKAAELGTLDDEAAAWMAKNGGAR